MINCDKCNREFDPEKMLAIEVNGNTLYYCISCLKEANNLLSMKIQLDKEEQHLLKSIRKFLKKQGVYEKN